MNPVGRAGIILVFFSLLAIGASWHYWVNAMAEMKAESARAHARLEQTVRECNAAIAAANQALEAREAIYEQAAKRMADLEQALSDADSLLIPDSLRIWYAGPGGIAAGEPAGSHSPAPAQ